MANIHLVTGHSGTAHITAADQGSFNAAIFGEGEYVLNRGNRFAATVVSNNQVTIADGDILMQGRHVRLEEGTTVDLTIDNGTQDMLRNDLIVLRYTKDISTNIEECNLIVIKGTEVAANPVDPEFNTGDLINDHVLILDMPLYRVPLIGINVQSLVRLFSYVSLGTDLSFSKSGTVNFICDENVEYDLTNVTSLVMAAANVKCHGFITFGSSVSTISVTGFAESSGDDINEALPSEVWEFSVYAHNGRSYIIWKNWSA